MYNSFQVFKTVFDVCKDGLVNLMFAISVMEVALKLVGARRGYLTCFLQTNVTSLPTPAVDNQMHSGDTDYLPTNTVISGAEYFIVYDHYCMNKVFSDTNDPDSCAEVEWRHNAWMESCQGNRIKQDLGYILRDAVTDLIRPGCFSIRGCGVLHCTNA